MEDFLKEIIVNLEYIMLPKLIQVIESVKKIDCIFVNDADSKKDQYKYIDKVIFLGYLNEYVKVPTILNQDANEDFKALNITVRALKELKQLLNPPKNRKITKIQKN